MEITLFIPHAIIFLYDLANKNVQIPKYVDDVLVSSNEGCVSVGTQADVDGEVTLKLVDRLPENHKNTYKKVFDGCINTPGKRLAISTSEEEGILEIEVQDRKAQVSIWVDDVSYPGVVLVEAE